MSPILHACIRIAQRRGTWLTRRSRSLGWAAQFIHRALLDTIPAFNQQECRRPTEMTTLFERLTALRGGRTQTLWCLVLRRLVQGLARQVRGHTPAGCLYAAGLSGPVPGTRNGLARDAHST